MLENSSVSILVPEIKERCVCVCVCVCVCERERERDECLLTGQNYLQETTYYMCLLFEN